MNLKYWLQQQMDGNNVPLDLPADQQDLHGLTLMEAVNAHNAWIDKLNLTLRGQNPEEYDPNIVGADHLCKVGQWIYGKGQDLAHFQEFEQLRGAHKDFHDIAGQILRLHANKKFSDALLLLRNEFTEASKNVKFCLVALLSAYHENSGQF